MAWRTHITRYGKAWWPGEPWVRWTFLFLFLLAAVLRCWDLTELPYTHDELSALVRIYPTLAETIQRGVIELDTHPPGAQVFEWVWTKLFGMDEAVVKLPFIVLSLAALFLLYRFALAWTSAPTALVMTTLLATLQYAVMYAQIARPYAVGLFTTALLADQLTRFLAFGERRTLVGVGVAAVLSAYTHHFSMMLAAIMIGTGLLLVGRTQRKVYLVMCLVAALAYVPNIPIFLKQLSMGGLSDWLAPPDRYWLLDYLRWIAHYSPVFGIVLLTVSGLALFHGVKRPGAPAPLRWSLWAWGLLPLAIGLAYSVWRAPVIQYSMLLFSFPYLLLALFAGLAGSRRKATLLMCGALATASVISLVFTRHHYDLFYRSKYEAMFTMGRRALAEDGHDRALILLDAPAPQLDFYMHHWHLSPSTFPHVPLRDHWGPGALDSLLLAAGDVTVVLGIANGGPFEQVARVQARFPNLVAREDLPEGSVHVFRKKADGSGVLDRIQMAHSDPEQRDGGTWDIHADLPIGRDTLDGVHYWNMDGREYGMALELDLNSQFAHREDLFETVVELEVGDPNAEVYVVMQLLVGDSIVFYRATGQHEHAGTGRKPMVVSATRALAPRHAEKVRLKTYVHNVSRGPVKVFAFTLHKREANPVQHALVSPVDHLGHRPE